MFNSICSLSTSRILSMSVLARYVPSIKQFKRFIRKSIVPAQNAVRYMRRRAAVRSTWPNPTPTITSRIVGALLPNFVCVVERDHFKLESFDHHVIQCSGDLPIRWSALFIVSKYPHLCGSKVMIEKTVSNRDTNLSLFKKDEFAQQKTGDLCALRVCKLNKSK